MTYRPDIDGLRAIAVLAVVIFHLGVPGFSGGFVGVDVFFVISGYLITGIIRQQYQAGRFSFADFYARRIRRLFPALIATVLATTLACGVLLEPYDMQAYGRSAVAALFSVSNILFFTEAGYWDTASELKPLLHTWSLGLEEQFYLLWPATLVGLLAWRGGRGLALPLIVIALAGAALSIVYTAKDAAAAFYLLPFRVSQFALGALMLPLAESPGGRALLQHRLSRNALLTAGLTFIALPVLTFGEHTAFPGWAVLIPSAGTALILLAGARSGEAAATGPDGLLAAILDNPVSLWLGRASYALYLVHWPIVSLYRYHSGQAPTPLAQAALAVTTFISTLLLHYGVERRFYHRHTQQVTQNNAQHDTRLRSPVLPILASLGLVALLPLSAWVGSGWSWREPDIALSTEAIDAGMKRRYTHVRSACIVDKLESHPSCDMTKPRQVLVFGNSHEPDGYNFLQAGFASPDLNLIRFGSTNGCPGLSPAGIRRSEDCQQRLDALRSAPVLDTIDTLVYVANKPFHENKAGVAELIGELKARKPDLRVITFGGYINTREPCWRLINRSRNASACRSPEHVSYFAGNPETEPMHTQMMALTDTFVDRVALLCRNRQLSQCEVTSEDGTPAFFDQHHLSLEFASMAGRRYAKQYPQLLTTDSDASGEAERKVTPSSSGTSPPPPQNPPAAAPRRAPG
jgi:peptidoglycan/LPS O-acetylase OafA/YrhL